MEINSKKVLSILITFLLFVSVTVLPVFAEEENRFSQKLEWKADPSAFEYRIQVKATESSNVYDFVTQENSISFSIPAGSYEWRVTAVDFLGRESASSSWQPFVIRKAITPEIRSSEKKVAIAKKDGLDEFKIPADVDSVEDGAKIELLNSTTKVGVEGRVEDDSFVFPKVASGKYKVKVTNPSGLSSESDEIKIQRSGSDTNKHGIYIELGAGVTYNLADSGIFTVNLDKRPLLIDADFKFEYYPWNVNNFQFGFGLEFNPTQYTYNTDASKFLFIFYPVDVNFLTLMPLVTDRFYFGAKVGAGVVLTEKRVSYFGYERISDVIYLNYTVQGGVFFRVIPAKTFTFDIGCDYAMHKVTSYYLSNLVANLTIGVKL